MAVVESKGGQATHRILCLAESLGSAQTIECDGQVRLVVINVTPVVFDVAVLVCERAHVLHGEIGVVPSACGPHGAHLSHTQVRNGTSGRDAQHHDPSTYQASLQGNPVLFLGPPKISDSWINSVRPTRLAHRRSSKSWMCPWALARAAGLGVRPSLSRDREESHL